MTTSKLFIYCGGILTLLMAIFHTRFYELFKWKDAFKDLSATNQKIIFTVHLALLLLFFIIAAISIIYGHELSVSSGLALGLNCGLVLFWLWRFLWQVFYYFTARSTIHYVLLVYFLILAVCYSVPVILRLKG